VSATGNHAASSDGSRDAPTQEAIQQIRAAMAALAQLNEAAFEAQQLLGLAALCDRAPGEQGGVAMSGSGLAMTAVPEGSAHGAGNSSAAGTPRGISSSGAGGFAAADSGASPFQQVAAWGGAGRSARRSSGGLSADLDARPSSFTAGYASGMGMGGLAAGQRRVSMDSGVVLDGEGGGGWRGGWSAGSRAVASRGRMSVDLSALSSGRAEARMRQMCPNLVKCEQESVAAIARQQQQQQ
jgi:hypothetical protein